MEAKKFVVLRYPDKEAKPHVCDSPKNAVAALDELGLCMNWALVTLMGSPKVPFLFYQGWIYKRTPERYVVLPFDEDEYFDVRFKMLLNDIFSPFISSYSFDDVHRSMIIVTPHPAEKDCFFVTLNLFFKGDKDGIIYAGILKALDDVDDSNEKIKGKVFWLD